MSRLGHARKGALLSSFAVGLAFAVGACSSSNNGGGATTNKDAAPGDGATTDGAAGSTGDGATADTGTPPLYDGGGEAGPVSCGSATCQPEDFRGLVTLHACCTQSSACGLDLGPAGSYVSAPDGCVARDNPGVADTACPSYDEPSLGTLSGCCRSDDTCGVFVKLSSTLDLGCVPAAGFTNEAGSAAPCHPDAGNDSGTFDAHTVYDAGGSDAQTGDGSADGGS